jgi:DNA invertase Pin-like site-specific DNA recombinase
MPVTVKRQRAKANDAVRLIQDGRREAEIAKALGVGRGSVYRALEQAGFKAA